MLNQEKQATGSRNPGSGRGDAGVKKSTKKQKAPTARDLMKLEIADELGLLSKVRSVGWEGLTAQEAGTVGGVMSHRLRRANPRVDNHFYPF